MSENPLPIELKAIQFAIDTDYIKSGAIPVFRPSFPEYPYTNGAVAYPISYLKKVDRIPISCCIKANSKDLEGQLITVRAVANGKVISSSTVNLNGKFSSTKADLNFVEFEFYPSAISPDDSNMVVRSFNTTWDWEWALDKDDETLQKFTAFASVPLTFYLTLNNPTYPWGGCIDPKGFASNGYSPSAILLRHACEWANQAKDALETASKIVTGIHQTSFQYQTDATYTSPTQLSVPFPVPFSTKATKFDGTSLGLHLRGMGGAGSAVNCQDVSRFVMLMGNILGCNLRIGKLKPKTGTDFKIKSVFLLGSDTPSDGGEFTFHDIAYAGDVFDENALVFDACLCFVGADNKPVEVQGIPLKEYLSRLVASTNLQDVTHGTQPNDPIANILIEDLRNELIEII